jgi:hypothetical protein
MPHKVHLSVHPSEDAHHISVDLNMEEPRQATFFDALARLFGPKCCVVEDLDTSSCRVYPTVGGALAYLDRKSPLSGDQQATGRELRERDSEPEG